MKAGLTTGEYVSSEYTAKFTALMERYAVAESKMNAAMADGYAANAFTALLQKNGSRSA